MSPRPGGGVNRIGTCVAEEHAARLYDEHAVLYGKPLNFPVDETQKQAVKVGKKGCCNEVQGRPHSSIKLGSSTEVHEEEEPEDKWEGDRWV